LILENRNGTITDTVISDQASSEQENPETLLCMQARNSRVATTPAKKKNRGHKHTQKGREYTQNKNQRAQLLWDDARVQHITTILHQCIPSRYSARETQADIYILCPFHEEKTASCAIGKKCGIVKCMGCGRAYTLPTFLSITLGNTRRRRESKLVAPLG
jgi:CHC2 zinc finger